MTVSHEELALELELLDSEFSFSSLEIEDRSLKVGRFFLEYLGCSLSKRGLVDNVF